MNMEFVTAVRESASAMKSFAFRHIVLTFLFCIGLPYAISFLAFGSAGVLVVAIAWYVGSILGLIVLAEKAWAEVRKKDF